MPFFLALKAEALFAANRPSEAREAVEEAEAVAQKCEVRYWRAELHRLRGVFLTALDADSTEIEASFREAISTPSRATWFGGYYGSPGYGYYPYGYAWGLGSGYYRPYRRGRGYYGWHYRRGWGGGWNHGHGWGRGRWAH